jgi:hypothetical protein
MVNTLGPVVTISNTKAKSLSFTLETKSGTSLYRLPTRCIQGRVLTFLHTGQIHPSGHEEAKQSDFDLGLPTI